MASSAVWMTRSPGIDAWEFSVQFTGFSLANDVTSDVNIDLVLWPS